MFNVYNHWDKLKSCIVGRTYGPDFYSFVKDKKIRSNLCKIAEQTEEDLINLCDRLYEFDVNIIRPFIIDDCKYVKYGKKILPAPLTPRDYTAVIDDKLFMPSPNAYGLWNRLKGTDWPDVPPVDLLQSGLMEGYDGYKVEDLFDLDHTWLDEVEVWAQYNGNDIIYDQDIDSAMIQRIGDNLYVGNWKVGDSWVKNKLEKFFPNKKVTLIETAGHLDGSMCIVSPDLILTTPKLYVGGMFPDHEIHTVKNSVSKQFTKKKAENVGKWWLPEQLSSPDFQDYIETYLSHWLGKIQESCFDVNLLIVDPENVFCSNEDPELFKVLERHGITPHVVPFRHQLFWDSGLHCLTSDLSRDRQC